jgi:hypothetical protein
MLLLSENTVYHQLNAMGTKHYEIDIFDRDQNIMKIIKI